MSPEPAFADDYFDTPARAERLQLLQYLVRNAGDVIYLRAPAGAGKTRFARELLETLGNEMATVWVRGGQGEDVAVVAADQLGLPSEDVAHWPDALLEALGDQDLLFVVDDADQLDLPAVERLAMAHAQGGRLLFLGRGGLARTTRDWDVQFVDLPAFDGTETAAFLRGRVPGLADQISDDVTVALHHATHGLPGPLLDALEGIQARLQKKKVPRPEVASTAPRGLSAWQWLAGGTVVVLLAGVLFLQDQINAFFEADESAIEPPLVQDLMPSSSPSGVGVALHTAPQAPSPGAVVSSPPAGTAGTADSPPAADGPEVAQAAAEPVGEAKGADSTDPLDAVMRDALAVAETPVAATAAAPQTVAARATEAAVQSQDATVTVEAPAAEAGSPPPASAREAVVESPAPATSSPAPVESPAPVAVPGAKAPLPPSPASAPATVSAPPSQPAPVEERTVPRPARAATPPPTTKASPPAAVAGAVPATTEGGLGWLKSRPAGHYTLQLVGARDRAGVERFVRDHKIHQPYAIFERQLDGHPWYSLVAGEYPDRAAALAARERLPPAMERSGVWPRSFESIFKSL